MTQSSEAAGALDSRASHDGASVKWLQERREPGAAGGIEGGGCLRPVWSRELL